MRYDEALGWYWASEYHRYIVTDGWVQCGYTVVVLLVLVYSSTTTVAADKVFLSLSVTLSLCVSLPSVTL